jgi:hypothetical protein
MTTGFRSRRSICLTLSLGIVVAAAAHSVAGGQDRRVYGVAETIEGKTYEQWTVAYARWGFAIARDRNPITDKTGEFAAEGQTGPVWFLGGNLGGTTRRRLKVPAGKPIFSPLIYRLSTNPAIAKIPSDRLKDVEVVLDGTSIGDLSVNHVTTPPFEYIGPDKDQALHPFFAGKRQLAMDGWWFMLKPPAKGEHTLHIKGRLAAEKIEDQFELDITYRLIVEEADKQ